MDVTWEGTDLDDGAANFDLGTIQIDQIKDYTFTVTNSGDLDLNFSNDPKVDFADDDPLNPPVMALNNDIAGASLADGASATFEVRVDATCATLGDYTASISIANDDADENPYDFTVQVSIAPQSQEINVRQGGDNYISGSAFDFGDVNVGESSTIIFTVENLGMEVLDLTDNPRVSITDDADNVFSVETDAADSVAAEDSTTFEIKFTPAAAAVSTATISIANDDADENPYEIDISGTDKAAPPTLNGIAGGSFNTDQSFTLTGIEPGCTAYYSLNNGTDWIMYAAEVTLSNEGDYQVVVKQIDDVTLEESAVSSPSVDITIDKTPPDAPTGLDLATADDTGDSAVDNITKNEDNLTISGLAEADADIDLTSDKDGLVGSTTANSSGSWSWDISLSENKHDITAVATDAASNSSVDSAVLTITVDVTDPTTPSKPDLADDDDTNINNDDITSNTSDLTFTGTAGAGDDIILESSIDGEVDTKTADGGGSWTFDPISLSVGNHSITAKTSDVAGNEAVSAVLALVIDNADPVIRTDKFSSTDTVVVASATTAGNYTTESGVSAEYDSVNKEVTLEDTAGNSVIVPNDVYEGAESGGLRDAVTAASDGDVIYIVEGTYTPSVNPVLINISASITIKGDGASTIIDNADNRSVFVIKADGKTVYFEGLHLNNNCTNDNQALIKSGVVGGAVYLKNITEGTDVGDDVGKNAYLVMISSSYDVYYWVSGSGYTLAQDGVDDWTDDSTNWIFQGNANTTYWTE